MKKLTIKLSDGRNIEEVIELKNVNSEEVFMRVKDVIIREMMDSNIDKRKDNVSEIKDIVGDTDGYIVESDVIIPRPHRRVKCKLMVRKVGGKDTEVSHPVADLIDEGKIQTQQATAEVAHSESHSTTPIQQYDDSTTFFMISKCPGCGKPSFYKTSTAGRFNCECGHSQPNSDFVEIVGGCPNCDNNIGSRRGNRTGTLKGMDVSDTLKCKRCESPVSMEYIEKKKHWQVM